MLMLNAQIFYYCALMALLKCSKGASPPLHLFFFVGARHAHAEVTPPWGASKHALIRNTVMYHRWNNCENVHYHKTMADTIDPVAIAKTFASKNEQRLKLGHLIFFIRTRRRLSINDVWICPKFLHILIYSAIGDHSIGPCSKIVFLTCFSQSEKLWNVVLLRQSRRQSCG